MKGPQELLQENATAVLERWMGKLTASGTRLTKLLTLEERLALSRRILGRLQEASAQGEMGDIHQPGFSGLREVLTEVSSSFAERGMSPSETATYVMSLKEAMFELYQQHYTGQALAEQIWQISTLIDKLALYTFETFTTTRERLIKSQAKAIADLSTPIIQVWEGIIALPLVGTVDSARAKEIMEKLLEAVIAYGADIVIIDITGVPVVDTQVANRLMRTVESVRLLGTRSIITGINPIIAQTLVQLGVDLSQLTTKASLRLGLQQAFRELKLRVSKER